jgi:hypothetical protein
MSMLTNVEKPAMDQQAMELRAFSQYSLKRHVEHQSIITKGSRFIQRF